MTATQHSAHRLREAAHTRLGLADIVRAYGIDAVRQRIEHLRETGQHHAALAVEVELGALFPEHAHRRPA